MLASGMALGLVALCVDANDPLGLARFWAEALHWEVADESAEAVRLAPTDGTRFGLSFGLDAGRKSSGNLVPSVGTRRTTSEASSSTSQRSAPAQNRARPSGSFASTQSAARPRGIALEHRSVVHRTRARLPSGDVSRVLVRTGRPPTPSLPGA